MFGEEGAVVLCLREIRWRMKLCNYVSVYDSHFQYVTINMFEAISHATTRFRFFG